MGLLCLGRIAEMYLKFCKGDKMEEFTDSFKNLPIPFSQYTISSLNRLGAGEIGLTDKGLEILKTLIEI